MHWLVTYDISDPKRLKRVARALEKVGLRCQKSVFHFHGSPEQVERLLEGLTPLLDLANDVVQAWRLAEASAPVPLTRGSPLQVRPASLVLGDRQRLFLDGEVRR